MSLALGGCGEASSGDSPAAGGAKAGSAASGGGGGSAAGAASGGQGTGAGGTSNGGGSAGASGASSAGGSTSVQAGSGAGGAGAGAGSGGAGAASGGSAGAGGNTGQGGTAGARPISFGTLLDAQAVVSSAQALAMSVADPSSPKWRAKGDQHRSYRFVESGRDEPYRIYVPTDWDGTTNLPLAMFLHGSGSDENSYLDQNNQQLIKLAQEHGYLLVSPLGVSGAYGNFLRLSAPFGDEAGAAELMAAVTAETERANALSEQDVINVLELVLNEYPVDRMALYLFGHSMGSGGTWYIGGKYATYFRAIAPMSGPFVQKTGYPWDRVRNLKLLVTEGTQTPSIDASRLLAEWLTQNGFQSQYREVNADHGGMIPLVLPGVFDFFDESRGK